MPIEKHEDVTAVTGLLELSKKGELGDGRVSYAEKKFLYEMDAKVRLQNAAQQAKLRERMRSETVAPSKNRLDALWRLGKYYVTMKAIDFIDSKTGKKEGETGMLANVKEYLADTAITKATRWLLGKELGGKNFGDTGDLAKAAIAQKLFPGQEWSAAKADLYTDIYPQLVKEILLGPKATIDQKEKKESLLTTVDNWSDVLRANPAST